MKESKKHIEFKSLEIVQPIGSFYIGAINYDDLIKISHADVRRLQERDVEKYSGIERPLSPTRVIEIRKYVNNIDATFPTNVILAVSSENASFDDSSSAMKITNKKDVAKIIDGQHRIAGLEGFEGKNFEIGVTIFIDMDDEDQAMVFSTINLKHTKVSKSLMYDLFEYAKSRSPQKTCHNIAKLLNMKDGSPFKNKIKILGKATGKSEETLTQATFVDRLIKYISKEPSKDRDLLKRGKILERQRNKVSKELIFRDMFIDQKDAVIAKNIWNYFSAVEDKWSKVWKKSIKGNILNRTTGFGALMRFLKPCYLYLKKDAEIVSKSDFLEIFKRINLLDGDFTPERYKPGSSGERDLFKDLKEQSKI